MTYIYFQIDPLLFLLLPAVVFMIPLPWCIAVFLSALIHEMAHYVCVLLLNGKIVSLRISMRGAIMDARLSNHLSEFLSILAGPVSSCALFYLYPRFPELAACGIIQGLYNLIPVLPLDGGRLLQCILYCWLPNYAQYIIYIIRRMTTVVFILVGIWSAFSRNWSIFAGTMLILSSLRGKIACKEGGIKVQ